MKISNGTYKPIPFVWGAATYPIKAGTPVGFGGVCNNGTAVGIVPQTIAKKPLGGLMTLLVGGDVELAEVESEFGSAISEEAKTAMGGIRFYGRSGTPDPAYARGEGGGGEIPAATTTTIGGVYMAGELEDIEIDASFEDEPKAQEVAEKVNLLFERLRDAGMLEGGQ